MLATLSRAAFRYTSSIIRRAGASAVHPDWTTRAEICERCPMRVVVGCVSYCGQPAYKKPARDEVEDGCGCPTREKAKSPSEHCPVNFAMRQAFSGASGCDCKWCVKK